MKLENGSIINQYKVISPIGKGGMGEVFLAQDTKLNRKVAIKFLNEEFSKDADKLNRFIQEAKAASALNHPNILTVHEIGENGDSNFIVTEFIEGKTLRENLSPKKTNSLNSILKIGVQVAEALLQNKKLIELFPNDFWFHYFNGAGYAGQGKYDQAVEELQLFFPKVGFNPENIAKLKEAYEKGGWDGYGRMFQQIRVKNLNAKQAKDPNGYVKAWDFAIAYALGKDKDKAIEYLHKAYDERDRQLLEIKVDKTWDFVRDDPRFKELVRRVGIPE